MHWVHTLLLLPAVAALTTEYCSNPPPVDNGAPTVGGRGILGYPVGTFAYYQCAPSFKSKDGVELYRSCEFNGERAVWSDASSECVQLPEGLREKRIGNAVLTVTGDEGDKKEENLGAKKHAPTPVVFSGFDDEDDDEESDEDMQTTRDNVEHQQGDGNDDKNAYGILPSPRASTDNDYHQQEANAQIRHRLGQVSTTGYALYPAVPFAEHQVTAFARFQEPPTGRAQNDIRDNGPTWNIPTGPHFTPQAPNERSRKVRIQMRPNMYLPSGEQPPGYTSPPQQSPPIGFGLDYPGWSPFQPRPDPQLSRYAYGCGPAPVIPLTRMSRPPQTRYSIGSVVSYFCSPGMSQVDAAPMQTMCVYDDGHAHWTPIEGTCVEDIDMEFPEDVEKDAYEDKKLQGWRMSKEQRPGYVMVEKEIIVPPYPNAETYNPPTRVSFARPAPGVLDAKPSRIASLPWPLNLLADDQPAAAAEEEDTENANRAPEDDRVVVSKTIFLQPPPFPNPPWRSGQQIVPQNQRQRMCAFLDNPPAPPQACRKPPSLTEIAIKTLFKDQGAAGLPADYLKVDSSSEEADFPFSRKHYGGIRNPEQIQRPAILPLENEQKHVSVNLVSNWKDDAEHLDDDTHEQANTQGPSVEQNDERNCVGDECSPVPGPDELEGGAGIQSFSYEVPQGMVKNGKVALNIFHGNDRRNFAGEGIIRSMGDTGFPFNEMYKQQPSKKDQQEPMHDKPRPNLGARAFALSERLMRGGIHGDRQEPEAEPAYITGLVLGVTGAAILAVALCRCISSCKSMLPGQCGFCPDDECADEDGGALTETMDDTGDGYMSQQRRWRKSRFEVLEHSDGH